MANVNPTHDRNSVNGVTLVTWALAGADTGLPWSINYAADLTVQVSGTFGGATAVLEGSNDGTNWATLNAVVGTNTSFTSAGIRKAAEMPAYIRAVTSGGTGSAVSVTVAIHALYSKVGY